MFTLIHGDALKELDILIKQDINVDISFTSPPYNRKRNDKYKYYDDNKKDWFTFNCNIIDKLLKVTKGYVFYNIQANYYNRKSVYKLIGHYNSKIIDIHIWEKSNPMPASGKAITNAIEYFIVLGTESLKANKTYTKNIITTSVNSKMPKEHKAVMKYEVAEHFIKNFTKKNDTILDCFLGMGTTGIVCKNLNRNFIGIEINKEYFNTARLAIANKIIKQNNIQSLLF